MPLLLGRAARSAPFEMTKTAVMQRYEHDGSGDQLVIENPEFANDNITPNASVHYSTESNPGSSGIKQSMGFAVPTHNYGGGWSAQGGQSGRSSRGGNYISRGTEGPMHIESSPAGTQIQWLWDELITFHPGIVRFNSRSGSQTVSGMSMMLVATQAAMIDCPLGPLLNGDQDYDVGFQPNMVLFMGNAQGATIEAPRVTSRRCSVAAQTFSVATDDNAAVQQGGAAWGWSQDIDRPGNSGYVQCWTSATNGFIPTGVESDRGTPIACGKSTVSFLANGFRIAQNPSFNLQSGSANIFAAMALQMPGRVQAQFGFFRDTDEITHTFGFRPRSLLFVGGGTRGFDDDSGTSNSRSWRGHFCRGMATQQLDGSINQSGLSCGIVGDGSNMDTFSSIYDDTVLQVNHDNNEHNAFQTLRVVETTTLGVTLARTTTRDVIPPSGSQSHMHYCVIGIQ